MTRQDPESSSIDDRDSSSILFICSGNICRSPTAEGVFRRLVEERALDRRFDIDSAGTHDLHAGDPPDPRTIHAARLRGYDLSKLRARMVTNDDFQRFDLLLAMDQGHVGWLRKRAPEWAQDRIRLFLQFAPGAGRLDVPDPYYGGPEGFERVLDLVEQGARGLLEALTRRS